MKNIGPPDDQCAECGQKQDRQNGVADTSHFKFATGRCSLVSPNGRAWSIERRQVEAVFDGQSLRRRIHEMLDRVDRVTPGTLRGRDDADAVQAVPADVVETLADGDLVKRRVGFEGRDRLVCARGVTHVEDISGWHIHPLVQSEKNVILPSKSFPSNSDRMYYRM